MFCGPEKGLFHLIREARARRDLVDRRFVDSSRAGPLTAEPVEGAPLTFQRVNDVHSGDLRVLGVGDRVTDHVLEEHFQHSARLFVNQTGYTFHAALRARRRIAGLGCPGYREHFPDASHLPSPLPPFHGPSSAAAVAAVATLMNTKNKPRSTARIL
ncbi:hypothetical protein EVAR_46770_1 [Eumeta japonica]|uniref:Uncharacterized protein n=1 Tax=Eumeta variegata TaxID=151549 RepID=A0A4C2A889_EUMVA|nr:hypothetical protein EVAR_46770_1 [Eumeta japonica]